MCNSSSSERSKRARDAPASSIFPMQKVEEVDENQQDDEDGHPDQVSTSASEASNSSSKNSQPPLLDFIGTTCTASTWFTSCFPCAVVDINHCDDGMVSKLNRSNAMSVMYGVYGEQQMVDVSNSFELKSEEKDEQLDMHHHLQDRKTSEDLSGEVDQLRTEPKDDANMSLADQCQRPSCQMEPKELQTESDTNKTPSRKKFNIKPKKPNLRKLFKKKQ